MPSHLLSAGRDLAAGVLRSRNRRELNFHVSRFFDGRTRDWLADRFAARLPHADQPAPSDDPRVVDLERRGYAMLPDLASPAVADALRSALEAIPCTDPY